MLIVICISVYNYLLLFIRQLSKSLVWSEFAFRHVWKHKQKNKTRICFGMCYWNHVMSQQISLTVNDHSIWVLHSFRGKTNAATLLILNIHIYSYIYIYIFSVSLAPDETQYRMRILGCGLCAILWRNHRPNDYLDSSMWTNRTRTACFLYAEQIMKKKTPK